MVFDVRHFGRLELSMYNINMWLETFKETGYYPEGKSPECFLPSVSHPANLDCPIMNSRIIIKYLKIIVKQI